MTTHSQIDLEHQVEKLEFALAISQSIGDNIRSDQIKNIINRIGYIFEEPGT